MRIPEVRAMIFPILERQIILLCEILLSFLSELAIG
jgi:hypothetical protein